MPYPESNRDAYLSAVDAMISVRDGQPADGRGGTGDVVEVARERGIPVTVVWPEGARRMEK